MATKDYKNSSPPGGRRTKRKDKVPAKPGSWWSFFSGLGVGLLIAFAVYLWAGSLPPAQEIAAQLRPQATEQEHYGGPVTAPVVELPKPKFDFYKILPEMEVPISDWEFGTDEPAGAASESKLDGGTYVLQVGSFKSFEDADRAKASLALRGISANIQRVVINGQDVWFRVHVGPLSDLEQIRRTRVKLIENDMDFILLRIGTDANSST